MGKCYMNVSFPRPIQRTAMFSWGCGPMWASAPTVSLNCVPLNVGLFGFGAVAEDGYAGGAAGGAGVEGQGMTAILDGVYRVRGKGLH